MAYAEVLLTGTYEYNGLPAKGRVVISPNVDTVNDLGGNVVIYGSFYATLDAAGSFSISLPATDDAGLSPNGFAYRLQGEFVNGTIPDVIFALPSDGGAVVAVDMTDVYPSVAQDPEFVPIYEGLSAYDVAVQNGFVGTEAAWLESLIGPENVLTIGTVQTLATGSPATAEITGESPNQVLNLGLPRGEQGIQGIQGEVGPAGDPNALTVGTVETVDTNTPAEVTITGEPPTQTINFKIPKGEGSGILRGEWDSTENYLVGEYVFHLNSIWKASAAVTGEPGVDTNWTEVGDGNASDPGAVAGSFRGAWTTEGVLWKSNLNDGDSERFTKTGVSIVDIATEASELTGSVGGGQTKAFQLEGDGDTVNLDLNGLPNVAGISKVTFQWGRDGAGTSKAQLNGVDSLTKEGLFGWETGEIAVASDNDVISWTSVGTGNDTFVTNIRVYGTPTDYMYGDTVIYDGKMYSSQVDSNTSVPGADANWTEILLDGSTTNVTITAGTYRGVWTNEPVETVLQSYTFADGLIPAGFVTSQSHAGSIDIFPYGTLNGGSIPSPPANVLRCLGPSMNGAYWQKVVLPELPDIATKIRLWMTLDGDPVEAFSRVNVAGTNEITVQGDASWVQKEADIVAGEAYLYHEHTGAALTDYGRTAYYANIEILESELISYEVRDLVSYNGSLWACNTKDTLDEPGVGAGWDLVVTSGETLLLDAGASVPADTPVGTIIFEKA